MYFTPIVIKRFSIIATINKLTYELRKITREPYYDDKNERRTSKETNKMFLSEFDNIMYLKREIIGYRWTTLKTLIYLKKNGDLLTITSISFPGGLGGLFYYGFATVIFPIIGLKFLVQNGEVNYLIFGIITYLFFVYNSNSEYKEQIELLKKTIEKIKNEP